MAVTARPYHHGNLRAALLEQAERTLAEGGDLSLRELARESATPLRAATSPASRRCSTRSPRTASSAWAPSCAA